jgi:signal transduction histidine kinase/ligand-binding sensor domain-containing protein
MKYFLSFVLIVVFVQISLAQNRDLDCERTLNQFVIDSWTKENGLPSNSLLNIIQTSDGYIYISSYEGLIRFNGVDFTVFNKTNTTEIINNGIGALAEDSDGTLWMTTQTGGFLSLKDNVFRQHTFNGTVKELHRIIFIDSHMRIWSSTSDGRLFFARNDSIAFVEDPILPQNSIYSSIVEDENEVLWLSTEGKGIFKMQNGTINNFTTIDGLNSNWINTLVVDIDGVVWVGTDKGVTKIKNGEFENVKELSGFTINKIIANKPDYVWFSSNSGVIRYHRKTNDVELLTKESGLANNHTIDMIFGAENTLWLTHYKGGLSRIKNTVFTTFTSNVQMSGKIVNTICELDTANYLVGYNNGKIIEIKENKALCYTPPKSLIGKRIRDIFKDSKNNIWISTYSGLLKVKPNGIYEWFSTETGFPAKYIRMVYEDRSGNIWVGTRNLGLIKILGVNDYLIINSEKGLNNNLIMSINEDAKGNLLVGTSRGGLHIIKENQVVNKYTKDDGLLSNIIFNTYVDSDEIIWIALKGGVSYINSGKLYSIVTNDSVLPYSPYDILEDNNGYFWMPCSDGIMQVKKEVLLAASLNKTIKEHAKLYSKQDGIEEPECTSTAAALKASDNSLWFPTINGISFTNPDYSLVNKVVPPVYIEQIDIDNKTFLQKRPKQIEPGIDRITFYYTSLSYYYSNKNQFQYKLIGYSDKWSPITYKRSVSYTNLPPGEYTFVVVGSNNDDLWNTIGDKFTFTIPYLWYQTIWFKIIVFFLVLVIGYLIYNARMKQLRKRERILKVLVKRRTAEITKQKSKIEERNAEILKYSDALKSQNEEIKTINEELERYRDSLEKLVHERTAELIEAKEKAEESEKLKIAFLTNMSHEIRTPMNAIVGFSDLLKMPELEKELMNEYIQSINENSETLLHLIDDIVEVSRIESGPIYIRDDWHDINEMTEDLLKNFQLKTEGRANIEIRLIPDFTYESLLLFFDKARLVQALKPIINNAIKYTEKGFVEIGYELQGDNQLNFYVIDTGIGIEKKDIEVIFERFRKIEEDNLKLYRGAGLGLYVSSSVINALGGKIEVESEVGVGSRFTIHIPVEVKDS